MKRLIVMLNDQEHFSGLKESNIVVLKDEEAYHEMIAVGDFDLFSKLSSQQIVRIIPLEEAYHCWMTRNVKLYKG